MSACKETLSHLLLLPNVLVVVAEGIPDAEKLFRLGVLHLALLGRELVEPHALQEALGALLQQLLQLLEVLL